MGRQDPVVRREGRQGGLAHAQGRRHGLADVQRLVERQSAQAVGVEVVRRQERLGAQERRLRRRGERMKGGVSSVMAADTSHLLSQRYTGYGRYSDIRAEAQLNDNLPV